MAARTSASTRRGDRAGLVGACARGPLERGLVGAQLAVALAHGREQLDHGLGHRLLEGAVARALELALDLLGRHAAR